ncbi:hypothetical protein AVEN_85844-1 [Araneus ventricosus]|uniref:Uncharacterized protein n=1 Tax=Araneus ventricosus TaxID=182803 RepID=A0A4Y2GZH7_ARAVE|nr:hypothetical protein AVEN_85844-1 [Araneus ventricosus]
MTYNVPHGDQRTHQGKQCQGDFETDIVILNNDQMTRTTPDLSSPLSKFSHQTSWRAFDTRQDLMCIKPVYAMDPQWNRVSHRESRYQSRDLTIKPFSPDIVSIYKTNSTESSKASSKN